MSEQETASPRMTRLRVTIPPLKDLVYEQCGYAVPATFASGFVDLHLDDWERAERDWENFVALVLDTDAVHPRASGGVAIRQAVEAAAAFLVDDELWPWCPMCKLDADDRTGGDR
jgi:hypothetical protein